MLLAAGTRDPAWPCRRVCGVEIRAALDSKSDRNRTILIYNDFFHF